MRTLRLLFALAILLAPVSLMAAEAGPGPATKPKAKDARARPAARPAPVGPVRIPIDLVLKTMEKEGDEEYQVAPDDRPGSSSYEPNEESPGGRRAPAMSASAFGANIRINNLVGAPPSNGEAEVSMAALGSKLVSGWNDGAFWQVQPGFVGYGYSTNGGLTWTDGGSLPNLTEGGTDVFYGDPVVVVDPLGHWYFADLWRPSLNVTGISVSHGTFAGAAPLWDPPAIIATSPTDYLDKPWLAVDPVLGTVYLAYVRFFGGGQQIEFARSANHGATWSEPVVMTSSATSSPMSPRLQVGPSGELYLAYYSYSGTSGKDYLRVRRSDDFGVSFGPEYPIGGRPFLNNYYSGPAGYNRERMVALVSIDVDRSSGPRRGTLYAVWQEGLDVDSDNLGGAGVVNEIEANGNSATATSFVPGEELHGTLSSTSDQDWWSFAGTEGQTIVLYLTPNASPCEGYLRMFAGGGTTANRCAFSYFSGGYAVIEFTLPSTATYYVRVLNADGFNIGAYALYTGWHTTSPLDVARDHRDVLSSHSSDGGESWSDPVLVNDDAARFDNSWPEVAVDAAGRVHVSWYDHRDDPANGILTTMYYARSDDGGASFNPSARFSTGAAVNWSNVTTNIFPNMGDYSALVADGMNVYANWADGRDGTPDSYFARLVDATTAVEPPAGAPARALAARGLQSLRSGTVRVLLSLPGSGAATLDVLDLGGRRVAALSLANPGQGDHPVELGEHLAAGMYFVRVRQAGASAGTKAVATK